MMLLVLARPFVVARLNGKQGDAGFARIQPVLPPQRYVDAGASLLSRCNKPLVASKDTGKAHRESPPARIPANRRKPQRCPGWGRLGARALRVAQAHGLRGFMSGRCGFRFRSAVRGSAAAAIHRL